MTKLGAFLMAILLTIIGIWIFQAVWNYGVIRAVTVTRPIDFLTAFLLILVFWPHLLALGAALFMLPQNIVQSMQAANLENNETVVRPTKNPPNIPMYPIQSY
jgi:hypothetical protein